MKALISCTENPKNFIEVLDELELFIDKKGIFDEKKHFRRSTVCRLSGNFVIHLTFFPFNLDTSPFRLRLSELNLSPIVFQVTGANSVG
jgi:hypothetical protein